MKRSLMALMLAGILALTALAGCGGGDGGNGNGGGGNPASSGTQTPVASNGAYTEKKVSISGYSTVVGPATGPDGSINFVVQSVQDESYALCTYANADAAPKLTPLSISEAIAGMSISPDGQVVLLTSAVSQFIRQAMGDAAQRGDSQNGAQTGGQTPEDGQDGAQPVTPEEPGDGEAPIVETKGGDIPAEGEPDGAPPKEEPQEDVAASPGGSRTTGGGMMMGGMSAPKVLWMDESGAVEKELQLSDSQNARWGEGTAIAALDGGDILIGGQNGVERYSQSGELITTYGSSGNVFTYSGGKVYLIENSKVVAYDADGGAKGAEYALPGGESAQSGQNGQGMMMGGLNDDRRIFVDGEDVYVLSSASSSMTRVSGGSPVNVMDILKYAIGDPMSSVSGYAMLSGGTLLALVQGDLFSSAGGGYAFRSGGAASAYDLCVYTWDAGIDMSRNAVLNISAVRDSQRLRKAISEFYQTHPNVTVNLSTLMDERSGGSATTDEIRSINADILAGKGADVLILDGLPYGTYAQKGVLMDLSDVVSDLGIFDSVVDGMRIDGKAYALPSTFYFSTLWGSGEVISASSSLEAMAEYISGMPDDKKYMGYRTPQQLLDTYFPESKADMTDAGGTLSFDTGEFERFLEALYTIYTRGMAENTSAGDERGGMRAGAVGGFNMQDLLGVSNGAIQTVSTTVSNLNLLGMPFSVTGGDDGKWTSVPGLDRAGDSYTPGSIVGINAQTKEKDLAMAFLKVMFGEAVQSLPTMDGLPVSRAVFDDNIATMLDSETSISTVVMLQDGQMLESREPSEALLSSIRNYVDTLKMPTATDSTLMNVLYEETAAFFEGSKSASETASAVQKRLVAYLSE